MCAAAVRHLYASVRLPVIHIDMTRYVVRHTASKRSLGSAPRACLVRIQRRRINNPIQMATTMVFSRYAKDGH